MVHSVHLRHELPQRPPQPCTCKADIERLLLDQFKQQKPNATGHKVSLQGYGFALVGNTMRQQPFMNFKAVADHPTATGASRRRTQVGVMHFSYCPFCGQSLKIQGG